MVNVMVESATPMRHDTRNPIGCCPRCYKAELLGRAARRPVIRWDKVEEADSPGWYRAFHGDQPVATLSKRTSGPVAYDISVDWESDGGDLSARTLRDARELAEQAYIEVWRDGRYTTRGPVHAP
jgi:hypothetical protein